MRTPSTAAMNDAPQPAASTAEMPADHVELVDEQTWYTQVYRGARAIVIGLAFGTILALAERLVPRGRRWLPSATGLGMGLFLPFPIAFSLFVGAVIARTRARRSPATSENYLYPVASGVIAGVSIVGVLVACLNHFVQGG